MTGLSDLSLVNLAFVSSNPPLSLFTLPSLACSSLSLRMRDTLLESDVGENTPEPRPRITPCRRNSLEDLFKWTYDYRGEREEKKKNTVFTQAVSTAFSPPCAGDISTLSCLNSHRQHAVRQHNPSTVPLLPSPEFIGSPCHCFCPLYTTFGLYSNKMKIRAPGWKHPTWIRYSAM